MFQQLNSSNLTPVEKDIFSYIIKNPKQVSQMRVKDLADSVHVAQSSVIKFIHKMKFNSFYELKAYLKQNITPLNINESKSDNLLGDFNADCLPNDMDSIIDSMAECLIKCQFVYCVGLSSSGILANYAKHQLSIVGCTAILIDDPFSPFFSMPNLSQDCAVIIFSVSGKTKELLNLTNRLVEGHINIISVTNGSNNPLAERSTINFPYRVEKVRINLTSEISSQLPVLFMIELLSKKIYQSKLLIDTDAH